MTQTEQRTGGHVTLRTDGASRGNPGPSAAGVIVEREGRVIARGGKVLGTMTNNEAEYRALILGLKAVRRYQPDALTVLMDSQLVVNQVNGTWGCGADNLIPLNEEARELIGTLRDEGLPVTLRWVRRTENMQADAKANEALDGAGYAC